MEKLIKYYCLIDTWNSGKGGEVVKFEGTNNECFEWIHNHTSSSFHEATTRQGYRVEEVKEQ